MRTRMRAIRDGRHGVGQSGRGRADKTSGPHGEARGERIGSDGGFQVDTTSAGVRVLRTHRVTWLDS